MTPRNRPKRSEWLARKRAEEAKAQATAEAARRPENSTSTPTPHGTTNARRGIFEKAPTHEWVANDGEGGSPSFRLGAYPVFRSLLTMRARCRKCGATGYFTPRTWASTEALGPGECPEDERP